MFFYTEHCVKCYTEHLCKITPQVIFLEIIYLLLVVNVWLREAHTIEDFATLANLTMAHLLPPSLPKIHFKLKKQESGEEWIPL